VIQFLATVVVLYAVQFTAGPVAAFYLSSVLLAFCMGVFWGAGKSVTRSEGDA
jgi:hypothetical protein